MTNIISRTVGGDLPQKAMLWSVNGGPPRFDTYERAVAKVADNTPGSVFRRATSLTVLRERVEAIYQHVQRRSRRHARYGQ